MGHSENVPRHIAFICDGNGRWATEQGLSRSDGHVAGLFHTRNVLDWCVSRGVEVITAYVWSTENWRRDTDEVAKLLKSIVLYGPGLARDLYEQDVRILHSGFRDDVPSEVLETIDQASATTRHCTRALFNLAFNYGGQQEIVHAIQKAAQGGCPLSHSDIESSLLTAGLPDVDLLIRPGGEKRISNFLLWQSAHAQLYFCDSYWPRFAESDLDAALAAYNASPSLSVNGIGDPMEQAKVQQ